MAGGSGKGKGKKSNKYKVITQGIEYEIKEKDLIYDGFSIPGAFPAWRAPFFGAIKFNFSDENPAVKIASTLDCKTAVEQGCKECVKCSVGKGLKYIDCNGYRYWEWEQEMIVNLGMDLEEQQELAKKKFTVKGDHASSHISSGLSIGGNSEQEPIKDEKRSINKNRATLEGMSVGIDGLMKKTLRHN